MKLYHLIFVILISSFLQASLFYGNVGSVVINLVLCVTWILYLTEEKVYAAFYVLFAGILVDVLKLSGIGMTTFLILVPLIVFILLEGLLSLKRVLITYLFMLGLIILGVLLSVFVNRIFGYITEIDWISIRFMLISALVNWVIIVVVITVRNLIRPDEGGVSFLTKR